MKRGTRNALLTFILVTAVLLGVSPVLYIRNFYPAEEEAVSKVASGGLSYETYEDSGKEIVFRPAAPKAGFIFYPGGMVQYEAYVHLMEKLAEEGVLCVLVHMPLSLAVLDPYAAKGIPERFPEVEDWYLGGHSLGGAMAAYYAAGDGKGLFKGLVLLGAYSTKDLSDSGLEVLSIYGSEDGVMNRRNYEKGLGNLPPGFREVVVEGGCHAFFGAYGEQKGDGKPTIERDEQLDLTAMEILRMMED